MKHNKKKIIAAFKILNDCVVSMDRIGSFAGANEVGNKYEFIIREELRHGIPLKITKARRLLGSLFSDEIIKNDMDELESECKGTKYWKPKNIIINIKY